MRRFLVEHTKSTWQMSAVILSFFFLFVLGSRLVQNIWLSQYSAALLSEFYKVRSIYFIWPLLLLVLVLILPKKESFLLPLFLFSAGFWGSRQDAFLSLPDWLKTIFILISMGIFLVGVIWRRFTWCSYAGPLAFFGGVTCASLVTWKAVFSLIWLLLTCAGLGAWANKVWEGKRAQITAPDVLVNVALGSGMLSLLGLFLASLSLAHPKFIIGLTVLLGVGVNKFWRKQVRALAITLGKVHLKDRWTLFILGFSCTLLGLFLLAPLGPEIGNDALGGRVALASRIVAHGKLVPDPTLASFTMGWAGGELFYVWFYPFVGSSVARLWAWGLLGLFLLWASSCASSPSAAVLAWLALAASTHIWWQLFSGFVDLHQGFLALAAVFAWRKFRLQPTFPALAMTFFLAGSASAVKMNGLSLVLALALASVFCVLREKGDKLYHLVKAFAGAAVGLLVAVGPWALRSFWFTGNPTYPFFNSFWQSPLGPPKPMGPFFWPGQGVFEWLFVPWNLFFFPEKFSNLGAFNPTLFFLLLVVLWLSWWERQSRIFLWVSGVWFFAWLVTEPNSRYLLPAAVVLMGAVWVAQEKLVQKVLASYGAIGLAILLGFLWQITESLFFPGRNVNGRTWPLNFVLGQQDEAAYLQSLPTYAPCQYLNSRYGSGFSVWQVNVRDALYCKGTVYDSWHGAYTNTSFLRGLLKAESSAPGEGSALLRKRGITHLMHRSDNRALNYWLMRVAEAFLAKEEACCLIPEFAHRGVRIFRLAEAGKKGGAWVPCQEKAPKLLGAVGRPAKVMFFQKFTGGELVRWQVGGQLAKSGLEASLAVWDKSGKLHLYHKEFWGLKPEGSLLEVWQTLPQEVGRVQLALAGDGGNVAFVHCEIWQPDGTGAGEGGQGQ